MTKLTVRSVSRVLEPQLKARLIGLSIARVAANLLDLLGLAGIALLAASFGSFASGNQTQHAIVVPVIGKMVLDEVQATLIALSIAIIFVLKSGFSIALNFLTAITVGKIEADMSRTLAENYFSLGAAGVTSAATVSEFQNRAIFSTGAIGSFLNACLSLVAEAALAISMIIIFSLVNPIAMLSMCVFMFVVLSILNRMIGFRIARNGVMAQRGNELALASSRDLFGVKKEAFASGVTQGWIDKFAQGRHANSRASAVIFTLSSAPRYVVETSLVLGIFGFLAGVVLFSDLPSQAVTIGVFMAGGLRLVASLLPLQAAYNTMQDSASRGQIAFNALLQKSEAPKSEASSLSKVEKVTPELRFSGVYFSAEGGSKAILENISTTFEPRSIVAIVGPSGAGKSTLIDLATGFKEPTSGKVTLGAMSPRMVLESMPGTIGLVTQRPHLVTGTIVENVSLERALDSDVTLTRTSLELAGLSKFTQTEGWEDQEIRPDVTGLSGGEIQRIGLARAIYRKPKLLFLDEATSALDAETEAEITKVLQSLKNEMTVVLIAHRLSTVQHADKIIYLDKGRIVAEGTFAELKAKVPDFAKAVELMDLSEG